MSATESPDVTAGRTVWAELRDAIRGTGADYTQIPLKRAVFLLAVPMVLELVLESTFAVVDIFFVAKLGSSAVATVGLTETFLFLLYSIAIGLAMAVTAIVARRIGEGKRRKPRCRPCRPSHRGARLGAVRAGRHRLGSGPAAADGRRCMVPRHGYRYTHWMLGGDAEFMLLFIINRSSAARAMRPSRCACCGWPTR